MMNSEENQNTEKELERQSLSGGDEELEEEKNRENQGQPVVLEPLQPLPDLQGKKVESKVESSKSQEKIQPLPELGKSSSVSPEEGVKEALKGNVVRDNVVRENEQEEEKEVDLMSNGEETEQETGQETGQEINTITEPLAMGEAGEEFKDLEERKQHLKKEIAQLEKQKASLLSQQEKIVNEQLEKLFDEGFKRWEQRQKSLEITIEQLEKRRDRIREEMRTSFAGSSQEIAIRVQGFKDFLVGSLQDLAAAAEQLQLPEYQEVAPVQKPVSPPIYNEEEMPTPRFTKRGFKEQKQAIIAILDQYRTQPDYYGPPWQLRRTFEPIHAERVQEWFFKQGGRGSIRSMGSRLQNILITAAIISILYNFYEDRFQVLLLANTPERLGEWRRGLQDCLGISRSDFGPSRGIGLFEIPEALAQRAERLVDNKKLPLIVIDESEEAIDLSLLQFPLLLAFAREYESSSNYLY